MKSKIKIDMEEEEKGNEESPFVDIPEDFPFTKGLNNNNDQN